MDASFRSAPADIHGYTTEPVGGITEGGTPSLPIEQLAPQRQGVGGSPEVLVGGGQPIHRGPGQRVPNPQHASFDRQALLKHRRRLGLGGIYSKA